MKEYTVDVGGIEHTVLLSDEDAKRLGAKSTEEKVVSAPEDKVVKTSESKQIKKKG